MVVAARINGSIRPVYVPIADVEAFAAAVKLAVDQWKGKCARYRYADTPLEQPDVLKTVLGRPLHADLASDLVEDDYEAEEDKIADSNSSTHSSSVATLVDDSAQEASTTTTTNTRKTASTQQVAAAGKRSKINQ